MRGSPQRYFKMRIQKYMSERKILSRRETESYILKGLIKVNGEIVRDLGRQIDPEKDKIEIIASKVKPKPEEAKITIAYNKPRGLVSSKSKSEGETIFDRLASNPVNARFAHLNAVGRLDKESEGLILLSNDGIVTSAVTGEDHKIEKEYEVETREDLKDRHMRIMERGMDIEGEKTLPAKTEFLSSHYFKIILKEGKHHQIRRMCAALDLTITSLKRIRIGNITIKGIGPGQYRELTKEEIDSLKSLAK